MNNESFTTSWFVFKDALIRRFRRQVSFIRVMQKTDACSWNLSKESFMEYAAKKIKLLQSLQLEQKNISLLVGGINNFSVRNTAASINVETIDEFLKRMHQLTTSMAT